MNIGSIFLNSSAQQQLNTLKSLNAKPLQRIEKEISNTRAKQPTLEAVRKDVTELKDALNKLKNASETDRAEAVKKFVNEFNDVQRQLTQVTGKDGMLRGLWAVRDARAFLRDPFQDLEVLSNLRDAGINTTREGLAINEAAAGSVPLSETVVAKLGSTVERLTARMESAATQLSAQLERLNQERERTQAQVERANQRTERQFMRYYQLIQAMNGGTNNMPGGTSFFA